MTDMKHYFKEIVDVIQSTRKGMALTWKHAWDARKQRTQHNIQDETYFAQPTGIATLQYPHVDIPTPDNGRYQLHNEMDDCIVCDKCVKVCPVDCIDIEPIKATGLVGHASDGSPIRLYAAKFDIDMSKCCFCGLCTTVCPTECLTMTSEYDFSVFEVKEHNFSFANLTAEEAEEKKRLYEQFVAEKEAMKQAGDSGQSAVVSPESDVPSPEVKKAAFKPSFKPKVVDSGQSSVVSPESEVPSPEVKKAAFKPSFKPKSVDSGQSSEVSGQELSSKAEPEGLASNVQSPTSNESNVQSESDVPSPEVKKAAFKPSFKPKSVDSGQSSEVSGQELSSKAESEGLASNVQSPTSNESNNDNPDEK
jgi:formate hydrogenlyase subunit 6/NADH:ubiquinone oxidoreductase subunit I